MFLTGTRGTGSDGHGPPFVAKMNEINSSTAFDPVVRWGSASSPFPQPEVSLKASVTLYNISTISMSGACQPEPVARHVMWHFGTDPAEVVPSLLAEAAGGLPG